MKAAWTKLAQSDQLKRSSHSSSVVDSAAYLFGGELQPRQPRDNDVFRLDLARMSASSEVQLLQCKGSPPTPRVGSATCALKGKIYLFSGRGGEAMAPIDEAGCLWVLDPSTTTWSSIKPTGVFPQARSYHSMTSDGEDTIYMHAGCPEKGRLRDLWAFSVAKCE